MKSRSFFLFSWLVIFSLMSSVVASAFVVCDHSSSSVQVKAHQVADSQAYKADQKSTAKSGMTMDGCAQGFCHLGHCQNLLIQQDLSFDLSHLSEVSYFNLSTSLLDRSLDGPFQPPKLA